MTNQDRPAVEPLERKDAAEPQTHGRDDTTRNAGRRAGFHQRTKGHIDVKTRHTTSFIQDESQVPAGYVAMPEFGVNGTEYKAVSRAQKTGLIRAVKLVRHEGDLKGGAVWVHKADADAYLRSLVADYATVEPRSSATADVVSLPTQQADAVCESLRSIDTTLDEMYRVLERLASAVESMATQPATQPEYASHYAPMTNGSHQ